MTNKNKIIQVLALSGIPSYWDTDKIADNIISELGLDPELEIKASNINNLTLIWNEKEYKLVPK
jgi:hypothetical protein